jgi:hypothetical protein
MTLGFPSRLGDRSVTKVAHRETPRDGNLEDVDGAALGLESILQPSGIPRKNRE